MNKNRFLNMIREMNINELNRLESEYRSELLMLNRGRKQPTGKLEPSNIKEIKKNIARILTVKKERQLNG